MNLSSDMDTPSQGEFCHNNMIEACIHSFSLAKGDKDDIHFLMIKLSTVAERRENKLVFL